LVSGITYSYIVVAYYSDGSESYASANVCAMLVRDVPIITNVSVMTTSTTTGSMWIHWIKPLATLPNLDTIANPPPYEYRLMKAQGLTGGLTFAQISSAGSYTYNSYHELTDTGFVDNSSNFNTQDFGYTYRIDFYANGRLVGSTNTASSVYLSSTPAGNSVNLTWQAIVPWGNYRYIVFKKNTSGVFDSIAGTSIPSYVDTGLVNGHNYCYKIRSVGQFSDTTIPRPLYNMSEIRCETPIDLVPPCQPRFIVNNDCGIFHNVISWTNPNTYCSHDAVGYDVYFGATNDAPLELIYTTTNMNDTTYTHIYSYEGVASTAGCYAVTAVDTVGNESPIVTKICVDNCPEYELPNVFTPNGDGINDFVTPLPGYRYVKDVDMKIFDRWGLVMFSTTDRDILWDGKNSSTKMACPDGVYFYVCIVNEIHVDGITPRVLTGFIQILKEGGNSSH
jgi:gliding motility-associated-like protein